MQRVKTLPFKAWTGGTAGRSGRRKKKSTTMCAVAFKPSTHRLFVFALSISTGCIDRRARVAQGLV